MSIKLIKLPNRELNSIDIKTLGSKRLNEMSDDFDNEQTGRKLFWEAAILVWYKEHSLKHLYGHLSLVSRISSIILIIGGMKVFIDNQDKLQTLDDYSKIFFHSIDHLLPIVEFGTLCIIILRIYAERNTIKNLLEND